MCSADVTFRHFQTLSATFQYAWVAFKRLITVLALYLLLRFILSDGSSPVLAAGGGGSAVPEPEPEGPIVIGSFVFLRNARYRPQTESVTLPRYWVARVTAHVGAPSGATAVNEAGVLRLQWHRETAMGSGAFVATPHYFSEKVAIVRLVREGHANLVCSHVAHLCGC